MPETCNFCGRAKRVCSKHPHGTRPVTDGGTQELPDHPADATAPEGSVFSVSIQYDIYYVRARTANEAAELAAAEDGTELTEDMLYSVIGPLYGDELPDDESEILEVSDGDD